MREMGIRVRHASWLELFFAAESVLPPVALDALLAVTVVAVVSADRTLSADAGVSSSSWQT